jgi:hypothetical protein
MHHAWNKIKPKECLVCSNFKIKKRSATVVGLWFRFQGELFWFPGAPLFCWPFFFPPKEIPDDRIYSW